ncbi:hypothetical protein LO762_01220 [Actinocorallia sp. API 0066]|uniref:hypothetical protein n=1 Tax=Actinocorallia sp. API 0066 TaxID=2896846 RepID=UPI001E60ABF1|nr:hypothetical protein [Actinocorallia sp. API 0066]MCD0447820.1 hypothetical protein [Actinocorallia sp. API 0066]
METLGATGPDSCGPGLRALVAQLWPSPAVVSLSGAPSGYRAVATYAVVPSAARAQFLVPLASRRVAAASLLRYNALRPVKTRVVRGVLGGGLLLGAGVMLPRLTVSLPDGVAEDDALICGYLGAALGRPVVFGVGVRPVDPNSKPTLQLFSPAGESVGYAKVGWNAATRGLAASEAAAITALPELAAARVPSVLHHGTWRGLTVTVTAPLPARVRGHRDPDRPPPLDLSRALAEPLSYGTLEGSPFWKRLLEDVSGPPGDASDEEFRAALRGALDRVAALHGTAEREFGRWHGDWVPWNLGTHRGVPQVFDWEHSAPGVPFGLDLLHWRFQVALVLRGRPLASAALAVRESAAAELGDPSAADLYLLEMAARTWRLRRGGGGWNPALHPAFLDVLDGIGAPA